MCIEEAVLRSKYNVKPTHTSSELESLAQKFADNIKLFAAYKDEIMLAGVVTYESKPTVQTQYIPSCGIGKKTGATELLLDPIITQHSSGKKYFDFGISTEKGGVHLNRGLVAYEDGFGARAFAYDAYEVKRSNWEVPLRPTSQE